ncbi:MAG TPA: gliding motility protein GldL [Flavobacteriales bacterium]|jgi:gliding motility-associated protein GldL|nr:gliding motility protein GldL [Flavobacteriales bacterium]HIO16231.1 gliding motility protein GldL [Flavobacteriales bacterium]HIO60105.1 gliding motility protein GldL [Flavobacteriales bacterium]
MKPGSKSWKNLMAKLYGIGASVVIIGALFKIQHWEYASEMLIAGLGTEALIFFFSAFEPVPYSDPDWTLVYPQLATGEDSKTAVAELDALLTDANIDAKLLKNLGDGMRNLGDQASKMSDMADSAGATQEFSDSLVKASNRVNEMADTYEGVSTSLTGLVGSQDAGNSAGKNLERMNSNLDSLNTMYEMQLSQLEENKELYAGMGELVKTLNDSVEDTKAYKEHIAALAQNLASLNTVYGNMLNAMGGNKG